MENKDFGQVYLKFDPVTTHYNLYHMFQPLNFAVHIEECNTAVEANQSYWKHVNTYKASALKFDEKLKLEALRNISEVKGLMGSTDPKRLTPPQADPSNDEDWGI